MSTVVASGIHPGQDVMTQAALSERIAIYGHLLIRNLWALKVRSSESLREMRFINIYMYILLNPGP